MHRFYLDGVKCDFLPWSMDALVSTLAEDYLFGDQQVSKNGISIALMPLDPQKSATGWSRDKYPFPREFHVECLQSPAAGVL